MNHSIATHVTHVLKWISQEYHDMNGTHHDTVDDLPSSLEFSKMVHISRPVLIRASPVLSAIEMWTDDYLCRCSGERQLSIAATPNGRADAVTQGPDGKLYFVEPLTLPMTMKTFLSSLKPDTVEDQVHNDNEEVHYLQSQNGNLFCSTSTQESEFVDFLGDIPKDLSWCTEALGASPDAVNLWIGDSRSVTSIHSDPYENVYCVIRGSKTFTLLPPTEGWCMKERRYPHATYQRSPKTSQLAIVPSGPEVPLVRWSSVIDPNASGAFPPDAHPITITVSVGESLYLPAGWWHHVRQSGVTVAVNYWYDVEGRGSSWVWLNLMRGLEEPPLANSDMDELAADNSERPEDGSMDL